MSADEPAPRLTPEQFIEIVYRDVYRSAVDGSVKLIESPPGRRPEQLLVRLNAWYRSLDDAQRVGAAQAMALAADGAVFGLLAILDNVRPVSAGFEQTVHLVVRSAEGEYDLTPDSVELHDLFRGAVDEGG